MQVNVGDAINYTYTLANTGNVALTQISLRDDNGTSGNTSDDLFLNIANGSVVNDFRLSVVGGDTDNDFVLDVGETWRIAAQPQTALKGNVQNIATVNASGATGAAVTDSDTANYNGNRVVQPKPGISFEKYVNGAEADTAGAAKPVNVGDAINYSFTLTNTGNTNFRQISLSDPSLGNWSAQDGQVTASGITYASGDDGDFIFEPGETWRFTTPSQTAREGLVSNTATVKVGEVNRPPQLSQTDSAFYKGSAVFTPKPSISFEKYVNGAEADTLSSAKQVTVGDKILYTYAVTNTGNVAFRSLDLVDDNATTSNPSDDLRLKLVNGQFQTRQGISYTSGDDGDFILEPGETWNFTAAEQTARLGRVENTATIGVGATTSSSQDITATDKANYVATDKVTPPPCPITPVGVNVDWKPDSNPSTIDLNQRGRTAVAILGSNGFDVRGIDVGLLKATDELLYGGVGVSQRNGQYRANYTDVNRDGRMDLVVEFDTAKLRDTLINDRASCGCSVRDNFLGDDTLYLVGKNNGTAFQGTQQLNDPLRFV